MSFSFCFIGNSHIAAIKQAWTNRAPQLLPGVSADFFSASASLLQGLELDGTVWRCRTEELREKIAFTSGGLETVDIAKYDAFAIVGIGFGLNVPVFCEGFDLASHAREPEGDLISQPCLSAIIETFLEDSLAVEMVATIKSVSDKPILLCAAPFLSERILKEEEPLRDQKRFQDVDFLKRVVAAGKAAGARLAARHGFALIWQEEETVGVPGFTKAEYGVNPARFAMRGNKPPPADRRHANEDYGFIMLTVMLQRLNAMSGGRVLKETPERRKSRSG
jgi:hypothetical protein